MRKTCLAVAVLLAGNLAVCRADSWDDSTTWSSFREKCAEKIQSAIAYVHPKDAGKDYVQRVDAMDVAPPAAAPPACASMSGVVSAAYAKCCCGPRAERCHRFCTWLTYRPLKQHELCDCCHKCNDCHVPPLYLYFLDSDHACAAGNGCANCAPHP